MKQQTEVFVIHDQILSDLKMIPYETENLVLKYPVLVSYRIAVGYMKFVL